MVVRVDDGSWKVKGDYVCAVEGCSWSRHGADVCTPRRHVKSKHPGLEPDIIQPGREKRAKLTPEEKVLSQREAKKRHLEKRKQSKRLVAPDLMLPYAVGDEGAVWMCGVSVGAGTGKRKVSFGPCDLEAEESCQVAISFVSAHAHLLGPMMEALCSSSSSSSSSSGGGGGSSSDDDGGGGALKSPRDWLFNKYTDLHVAAGGVDAGKDGPSASACVAIALVVLLGQRPMVYEDVGVTGTIDLSGNIGAVGGVEDKIKYAMHRGFDLMIVPAGSYDRSKLAQEEVRKYADQHVKGVKHVVEVMELVLPGKWE